MNDRECRRRVRCWRNGARERLGRTLILCGLGLAACDIPTSAPILEPRFVIPGTSTTMAVAEMLPGSVTHVGQAFAMSIEGAATKRTLVEMCGAPCALAHGFVVPKPPFSAILTSEASLPEDVLSAEVRSGTLTLRIANHLNFDPLRPSATAQGSAVIQVRQGDAVIATRTITALPAGSVRDYSIPVPATRITGPLRLVMTIQSPAGDPVRVDTTGSITLQTAGETSIEMTEAVIRVEGRQIQAAGATLDLTGIDGTTRDHVREGALIVRVENPFAVSGDLELTVVPEGGETIRKVLSPIPIGQSTQRVPFTGEEMRQIPGRVVRLSVNGEMSQTSDAGVRVRPGDVLRIRADLDLTISTAAN